MRARGAPTCKQCGKKMARAGQTVAEKPVWGCPRCLTIRAGGPLRVPETPSLKPPVRRRYGRV